MKSLSFWKRSKERPRPTPKPSRLSVERLEERVLLSLVAAYNFDEGSGTILRDWSGNGNNGTIVNASWSSAGKFGDALFFNASNAQVNIPDAASLRLTTAMTLEAWVQPTAAANGWQDILAKNGNYFLASSSSPANTPVGGGIVNSLHLVTYGMTPLPTNTWSFLTATYDGTTMWLFVNGVVVASQAGTGGLGTSTSPLEIGAFFQGLVDNVRIYNTALTRAQIQSDMSTPVVGSSASLTLSPASLPNGVVNSTYTATLNAGGGSGTYTFAVTSGSLPSGLMLNGATGVLNGTPTMRGTSTFTITAIDTNAAGLSGSQTYTLSVNPASNLTLSPTSLPSGTVNNPYRATLSAAGGSGTYTFAVSSGGLPSGLRLNGTTGVLSGTATTSGISAFTITAIDSNGLTGSQAYTLNVNPVSNLILSPASLPSGTLNTLYRATLSADGGSGTYTFAVTSGSLPSGLVLHATGILSGIPTATGSSMFTIMVIDTNRPGLTGSQVYTLAVNPAGSLTVSPVSLPSATVNGSYRATLGATGGSGTYAFAVSSGSLPSGLTLNGATGVLSGTPTTSGTSTFTITAADSKTAGLTGSQTYTLDVNPVSSLALTPGRLPSATVNTPYGATLSATGGSGTYTFAVTSGSLPSGLTLNATTGVLSGTPNTSGTSTFAITVADSNLAGLTGSQTYTLAVNPESATSTFPNTVNVPPLPAPTGTIINVSTISQLQDAVAKLQSGQTIVIAPGTYNLSSSLYIGLTRQVANVAIRGATNNPRDVMLIGPGMDNSSVPMGISVWNAQDVTIANLSIGDVYYHDIELKGEQGADRITIYNDYLFDGGEQIIKGDPTPNGGGVTNSVVEYCTIGYTTAPSTTDHGGGTGYTNGVDILGGSNWTVMHNLFQNFHTPDGSANLWNPAVLFWDHAADNAVWANTFINCDRAIAFGLNELTNGYDNQGGSIQNNMIYMPPGEYSAARAAAADAPIIAWDSPGTTIDQNTILVNGNMPNSIQVRFVETSNVLIRNNLSDANLRSRDNATYTSSGNYQSATVSMFVNPSIGDLHLVSNSQTEAFVIGKAAFLSNVRTDYDGDSRNDPTDIGADQYP